MSWEDLNEAVLATEQQLLCTLDEALQETHRSVCRRLPWAPISIIQFRSHSLVLY